MALENPERYQSIGFLKSNQFTRNVLATDNPDTRQLCWQFPSFHESRHAESSAEDVLHGIDEFLDGCLGFIAHVGDAEGFTFDLAVAAVDEEVVFGFEIFDEA